MIKKAVLFIFATAALLFLLAPRNPSKESKPFSLEAIFADVPYCAAWDSCRDAGETEVIAALSQPYRYLGGGGQCYAFVSQDNQYVIKFFKQKAFTAPSWMFGWLQGKKMLKRQERRNKVFQAFKLSCDHLPQETGMLYVHLNRTSHLNKTLSLCDADGHEHLLNLDELEFVIQSKAELIATRIDSLMKNQDVEGAKQTIDKLIALNVALYRKGFRNRDPNLSSNSGFIGENAVLIDVGRVVYSEEIKNPRVYKKELVRMIPRFRKYLAAHYPELLDHFDQRIYELAI